MITSSGSKRISTVATALSAPPPDALSDVLLSLGVRTHVFCRATLGAPWVLQMPEGRAAQFHLIERGPAFLLQPGRDPLAISAGDLVVVARGERHQLSSTPEACARAVRIPRNMSGRCHILQKRGGEPLTEMLCGGFGFTIPDARLVDPVLPALLHVKAGASEEVTQLMRQLWQEIDQSRLGAAIVSARLTDALFVQTIRIAIERGMGASESWLQGLQDPRIGLALSLLHAKPATAWTVAKLAAAAGMSRARFAARFAELLGMPPLSYLTRLRIARAAEALRAGAGSLREIAERAGYESQGAFNNVFRRIIGSTPGAYRRASKQD
jgi:AraC-like DNA-binding protein